MSKCLNCSKKGYCPCNVCFHLNACFCSIFGYKNGLEQEVDKNGICVNFKEDWVRVLKYGRNKLSGKIKEYVKIIHDQAYRV